MNLNLNLNFCVLPIEDWSDTGYALKTIHWFLTEVLPTHTISLCSCLWSFCFRKNVFEEEVAVALNEWNAWQLIMKFRYKYVRFHCPSASVVFEISERKQKNITKHTQNIHKNKVRNEFGSHPVTHQLIKLNICSLVFYRCKSSKSLLLLQPPCWLCWQEQMLNQLAILVEMLAAMFTIVQKPAAFSVNMNKFTKYRFEMENIF